MFNGNNDFWNLTWDCPCFNQNCGNNNVFIFITSIINRRCEKDFKMAGVVLGGGFKPMSRIKLKMDVSMAMAVLDFPPSQAFEHTELIEVEKKFMLKIHQIELEKHDDLALQAAYNTRSKKKTKKDTVFFKKKSDARKLNEAFQFLVQRRRHLSGRSMQSNWQLLSSKTNSASSVTNAFMLNDMPIKEQEEEEKPLPKNPSLLTSILALSDRSRQPATEPEDELGNIEERNDKGMSRAEQSQLARELAAEFVSNKRIRSLDEVLYESRTTREMNYWVQFSYMSKENRDYFTMRHGRNPDNFISQLKKAKKENNRVKVTLPDRLQKLQRTNNKRMSKNRNRDPRVPTRNRINSSKNSNKLRNITNNDCFDDMRPKTEDDEYENLNDPLNLNKNNIFVLNEANEEEEYIDTEVPTSCIDEDYSHNDTNCNERDEKLEKVEDCNGQKNRADNMNTKLKVLRRKLSHLNLSSSFN